ncbi:MAG: SDR family NAD(P)-dependent oxidoreductase [Vulcanimicrobiota bacterium]
MADFFPNSALKVFVTGGNSGLGKALAEAYYHRGAQVVIGGRDERALKETADQYPGMKSCLVDLARAESIASCAAWVRENFSGLNVLINNAGVQKVLKFDRPLDNAELLTEVQVNFSGLLLLTNALLPTLLGQEKAALINVGSGLAFVPLASTPVYCASKAAVHSFSVSLRHQLRTTGVRVIEIIPPKVTTNLHRDQEASGPGISVQDFIKQTLIGLHADRDEIYIGRAKLLYYLSRLAPAWIHRKMNSADPR